MSRSLATVVRVVNTQPIEEADRLEYVQVLGWWCCATKGEFKVGDLCIYFSVDSILDENENTAFLQGKPLKTRRMCGVISQGLLAPLDWVLPYNLDPSTLIEDQDLTAAMRVKKWSPPEEEEEERKSSSNVLGVAFPKTHETRLQDKPRVLDRIKNRRVVVTQKWDGCSATYTWHNGSFYIFSRNCDVTLVDNHYRQAARELQLESRLASLNREIAIQGELVSPRINRGRTNTLRLTFKVFNIWDISTQKYLLWEDVKELCFDLGLETVTEIATGFISFRSIQVWFGLANSQEYPTGAIAEGIVVKTDDDLGPRESFKVIATRYLLKHRI